MNRQVNLKSHQSGQTLVEFALAFPVLAFVLFAIIQYGFIFSAQMTLRHAAQVTSRTMSLAGANSNNLNNVASAAIGPTLSTANLLAPTMTTTNVGGAAAVAVRLQYDLPLIIKWVVPGASNNNIRLTAVGIDRKN